MEVHHVHPPPASTVGPDQSGKELPENSDQSTLPPQTPLQEGSEGQSEVGNDVRPIHSQRLDPSESQASKEGQGSGKPSVVNQTRETDTEKQTMPNSSKVVRVSHVNVRAGSPLPANPGETHHHLGKIRASR